MENKITTNAGIVTIRLAETQDAVLIRKLRLEALDSDPPAFAADYELTAKDPTEKWVNLIKGNTEDDKGAIWIAETENILIGMCGITRGHWPKTSHNGIIWGVYVNRDWRGHHIAQAMIDSSSKWGKVHGLTIVKLGVSSLNESAIRCYSRCGFSTYGTEPKALFYEGVYIDEYLMAKDL